MIGLHLISSKLYLYLYVYTLEGINSIIQQELGFLIPWASESICPERWRPYQFQCGTDPIIWIPIPCHPDLPGKGNSSTWRGRDCSWRQCQISFPLGWYLGIKPAGRLLEGNLPNSVHICNWFLCQMLPQKIWKSADSSFNMQLCQLEKGWVFIERKENEDLLLPWGVQSSQTMQHHVERTDGNPRS